MPFLPPERLTREGVARLPLTSSSSLMALRLREAGVRGALALPFGVDLTDVEGPSPPVFSSESIWATFFLTARFNMLDNS